MLALVDVQVHLVRVDPDLEEIAASPGFVRKFDRQQGVARFDRDGDEAAKQAVEFRDGRDGLLNGGVARDVDFDGDGVGHVRFPVASGRVNIAILGRFDSNVHAYFRSNRKFVKRGEERRGR